MSHESSLSPGHRSCENERKRRKMGSVPVDRNTRVPVAPLYGTCIQNLIRVGYGGGNDQ
jgi:hypothetical protein